MADRDGLKPASEYPEAIYLQRTHEDGSEMLYPHDATWTETSDCGYDIKYIRADIASPQPAPHAMSRITELEARTLREGMQRFAAQETKNRARDLIALLAQPAAVEPATVQKALERAAQIVEGINIKRGVRQYKEGGWEHELDKAAREIRALKSTPAAPSPAVAEPAPPRFDQNYVHSVPEHCDRIVWRGRYYGLAPDGTTAAEPDRKAIDAQGAEAPYAWSVRSLLNESGTFLVYEKEDADSFSMVLDTQTGNPAYEVFPVFKQASPLPAATLGKAEDEEHRDFCEWLQKQKAPAMFDHAALVWSGWLGRALAQQPAASDVRDKERLDWLDKQGVAYGFEHIHEGNRWEIDGPFNTARDAIDSYIAANHPASSTAAKGDKSC